METRQRPSCENWEEAAIQKNCMHGHARFRRSPSFELEKEPPNINRGSLKAVDACVSHVLLWRACSRYYLPHRSAHREPKSHETDVGAKLYQVKSAVFSSEQSKKERFPVDQINKKDLCFLGSSAKE